MRKMMRHFVLQIVSWISISSVTQVMSCNKELAWAVTQSVKAIK